MNLSDNTVDMPSGGGGTYTLYNPYTHFGGGGLYFNWNSTAAHTRWTTATMVHSNGNTTSINRSPIPESSKPTSSYLHREQQSSLFNNDDMGVESITRDTSVDSIQSNLMCVFHSI